MEGDQTTADTSQTLISWLAASGLAAGADLSRVSLPMPFFLPKTMLEMLLQTEMRRVDLLLQVSHAPGPLDRFKRMLAYYFSCCALEAFGKKPLYSRPGETIGAMYAAPDGVPTHFFAEQVPGPRPTVAATLWNEALGIRSTGTISVKEEFWGSSIHAVPEGLRVIQVGAEQYSMTPPSIAVRLMRGFSEYVGESVLQCPKTHLKAVVEFLAKPLVWGEPHAVRGVIVDTASGEEVAKLSGTWANKVWAQAPGAPHECIHAHWEGACDLVPIYGADRDTRKVWDKVKAAIREADWAKATAERQIVEQLTWEDAPKYFTATPGSELYTRTGVPTPQ